MAKEMDRTVDSEFGRTYSVWDEMPLSDRCDRPS
jgi:hypothetical protein